MTDEGTLTGEGTLTSEGLIDEGQTNQSVSGRVTGP